MQQHNYTSSVQTSANGYAYIGQAAAEFVADNMANFRLPTREDFEAEISQLTSEKETIQAKIQEFQTRKATLSGEEAGKIGKEIGGLRKSVQELDKKLKDLQTRLLSVGDSN